MVDIQVFPYLGFVRFDLPNKEFIREFNRYFDEHIQDLADKPRYSTAWRTQELRGDNAGVLEQEFQQMYAIEDPGVFQSFPQDPPPPVMETQPWRRDTRNWGRVFYRVIAHVEKDARDGRCLARLESNVRGAAPEEQQFVSKSTQHLNEVLKLPGVHRAWQLQHAPHPSQIGPDPVGKYMQLYEADAPENLYDPSLGEDRLPLEAGQALAGRHFARVLLKVQPR